MAGHSDLVAPIYQLVKLATCGVCSMIYTSSSQPWWYLEVSWGAGVLAENQPRF